jgi:hypothetical protein
MLLRMSEVKRSLKYVYFDVKVSLYIGGDNYNYVTVDNNYNIWQ